MTGENGITRVRTATLCVSDGKLLCVELRDPTTRKRFWSLPGGAVEQGESAVTASERWRASPEVIVTLLAPDRARLAQRAIEAIEFRGDLLDDQPGPVNDADFLLGCAWLPVDRIARLLSPHPEISDTVVQMLGIDPQG